MFAAALALAACGGKPAERPAVAKVGALAPELKLETVLQGDPKAVASWEAMKDKVVVLEFWATYCDPCVENIPHLNALAEKFKDKPVIFISASKEPGAEVAQFLKTHEIKGVVSADAAAASKSYGVNGVPKTVLIGRDGRVASVTYPSEVGEKTIEALLAGKALAGGDADSGAEAKAEADEHEAPYFSLKPTANGPYMSYSDSGLTLDGLTLEAVIKFAMRTAHGVELKGVDDALLAKKYSLVAKVKPGGEDGGAALRDLVVKGFNGAGLPLGVKLVKAEKDVYLLEKFSDTPLLKPTDKRSGRKSSRTAKEATLEARGGSMGELAKQVESWLGVPVLDGTGLAERRFDFDLKISFLRRSGQCTPCIHLRIFGVMSSSRAAAPRPVAVGIM